MKQTLTATSVDRERSLSLHVERPA